jgi:hypothetical protein
MTAAWRCGDCGARYPKNVTRCTRPFDDYLALRGGTIESAIARAVEQAIAPLVREAERKIAKTRIRWQITSKRMVPADSSFPLAG